MATKPKPKFTPNSPQGKALHATQVRLKAQADAKAKTAKAAADQKLRDFYAKNGHLPTIGAQETRTRFNTAPDAADLSRLGAAVANGKMTRAEFERQIRQGAAVNDQNDLRVGLDVAAEIDPKLNAIERRRAAGKSNLDYQLKSDSQQSARESTDAAGIYAAILNRLGGAPAEINAVYDKATGDTQANYQQLQAALAAAYEKANAATQAQVTGMQGGQTQGQALGGQDAAAYAAIAGIQNQGLQGIYNTARTGAINTNTAQMGAIGAEGARDQSAILQRLTERAAELKQQFGIEDTELAGQYADIDESRYNKLYEGKQSLTEKQAADRQAAEDRAYERSVTERSLGLKQYGAETDRLQANNSFDLGLARIKQDATNEARKYDLQVQQFKQKQAETNDPLQRQLLQAKIEQTKALSVKALTDANGGAGGKVDKYTQGMSVIQNIPGITPQQMNYLMSVVDSAYARTDGDKFYYTKGNEYMMDRLNKDGINDDVTRRYVRQALGIILGLV